MKIVTTVFTCGILRLMGNFQQAYGTLENMQSWLFISNFQFFCYLAQLSQLCSCWGLQLLSLSKEDRRDETSAVNIEDTMLSSLISLNCDCRCWSQGTKVGCVLGRTVSGLLHPEAVLALEQLEQFPAAHIGAESLFLLFLCKSPHLPCVLLHFRNLTGDTYFSVAFSLYLSRGFNTSQLVISGRTMYTIDSRDYRQLAFQFPV